MKKILLILIMLTIYANSTTTEEIRKLCEAGDAKNCKIMGDLTRAGLGVEQDDTKAHYYYDKACFDGYKDACKELEAMRKK
jgi:TPR repeat protein